MPTRLGWHRCLPAPAHPPPPSAPPGAASLTAEPRMRPAKASMLRNEQFATQVLGRAVWGGERAGGGGEWAIRHRGGGRKGRNGTPGEVGGGKEPNRPLLLCP